MRIFFFLLSLTWFSPNIQAQIFQDTVFEKAAWKGIDQMYNLDNKAAHQTFLQLKEAYSQHPAPYFLLAINRWWQIFMSENMPQFYEDIHAYLDKALELNAAYEDLPEHRLEYTYFQFMIYAMHAKAYAAEGKFWDGANAARKVISYLKDGFEYQKEQPEFYFSSGLYHYYAETYPKQHVLARPFMIFFPSGDMEKGLEEMEKNGAVRNYSQIECLFYLEDIYLDEIGDYEKGLRITRKLTRMYPQNTWFKADYAHALLLNNRYAESEGILNDLISAYERQAGHDSRNINSLQSRFTTHLMTKVYHYKGKSRFMGHKMYAEAKVLFEKSMAMAALVGVEEDDLLAADVYYIGRCYDAMGQRTNAIEQYKKALKMDQNLYIKDQAKECLKDPCK